MLSRLVASGLLLMLLPVLLACAAEPPQSAAGPEYLEEDIPPCTAVEGSDREPCGPTIPTLDTSTASLGPRDDPVSIRMMLGDWHEYMSHGELVPALAEDDGTLSGYMVLRATYLPGTVRCEVNRNFRYLGETTELVFDQGTINRVQCFVDIRVNSYILGTGPPQLSVIALMSLVGATGFTPAEKEAIELLLEQQLEGTDGEGEGIVGREAVLFIGPSFDYSVEAWEVHWTWGVNQLEDGTVMIIHPRRNLWPGAQHRSHVEMTLADFTAAVTDAQAMKTTRFGGRAGSDPSSPMVVLDANMLDQHHIDTGSAAHPAGPPELPPPARCAHIQDNRGLASDCGALLAAKDALRGDGTLNWSVDVAMADWDGIRTRGTGRVTDIILVDKGLTGTVPTELGNLSGLQHLWLNINQLTGTIPPELGSMPAIKSLLLNDNRLTGPIPTELGNLTTLESLWLQSNQLSGAVPSQLAQLSNLEKLTLSSNALTGEIPSGLGSLSNLEILWLSHNQLTGNVPSELGNLSNLQKLNLSNNQLTGAIPTSLGDLADTLTELRMANNAFTGCIPPALRSVAINDVDRLGLSDCTG